MVGDIARSNGAAFLSQAGRQHYYALNVSKSARILKPDDHVKKCADCTKVSLQNKLAPCEARSASSA
jgi:hypothetical protein